MTTKNSLAAAVEEKHNFIYWLTKENQRDNNFLNFSIFFLIIFGIGGGRIDILM